jgi:hypothetical protein
VTVLLLATCHGVYVSRCSSHMSPSRLLSGALPPCTAKPLPSGSAAACVPDRKRRVRALHTCGTAQPKAILSLHRAGNVPTVFLGAYLCAKLRPQSGE